MREQFSVDEECGHKQIKKSHQVVLARLTRIFGASSRVDNGFKQTVLTHSRQLISFWMIRARFHNHNTTQFTQSSIRVKA